MNGDNAVHHSLEIKKRKLIQSRVITLDSYDYKEVKIKNTLRNNNEYKTLRFSIIEWLFIINSKLEDSPLTLFHCLSLFDMMSSKNPIFLQKNNMDLYAAVCYFISKKLNEIIIIDISFVSKIILKNKYSHKEIANAEIDICKLLHFDLASNTIQDYTDYLITKLPIDVQSIFSQVNLFFNIFSQNFDEFIFDTFPSLMSLITIKVSLEILYMNEVISEEDYHSIELFLSSIDRVNNNSLRNKEREYFVLMLNAFLKNIKVLEKKEYSKLCKVIYKKGII